MIPPDDHTTTAPPPPKELLNRSQIAKRIGRSAEAVGQAVARLKIQPTATSGRVMLYPLEVVETIRESMRAPNGG